MTLSKSYNEIMDKLSVTPDMRQRILSNLPHAVSHRNKILRYSRIARSCSLAACIALAISATILFSNIATKSPDSTDRTDDNLTQTVNGIEECTSLKELSSKVGFPVAELNGLPFAPEKTTYLSYWNTLAEINYTTSQTTLTFRKSQENEDNSGDYTEYSTTESVDINGISVTLKGNDQIIALALWQDGKFSYSISVSNGISRQDIIALITNNISS